MCDKTHLSAEHTWKCVKFRTSTKHNLRCVLGAHQGVFGEHMKRCVLIHSSMCVVLRTKKVCCSNTPYLRVSTAKKFFHSHFPFPCFDVPKASNFTSGESVFREAWSPELRSQSLAVSCFWCRGFVPHRKWNLTLLAHQNTGKGNRYRNSFLLHLSAHWGDLIEQIKKICHIHVKCNNQESRRSKVLNVFVH